METLIQPRLISIEDLQKCTRFFAELALQRDDVRNEKTLYRMIQTPQRYTQITRIAIQEANEAIRRAKLFDMEDLESYYYNIVAERHLRNIPFFEWDGN